MKGINQWVKLQQIKCPIQSEFTAILDSGNRVHIFSQWNNNNTTKHYSIPISVVMAEISEINDVDEQKCSNCDTLRTEKMSLQTLVDELLNKQTALENEKNAYKKVIFSFVFIIDLKSHNNILII